MAIQRICLSSVAQPTNTDASQDDAGTSLIEMLVALFVFGLVTTLCSATLSTAARLHGISQDDHNASLDHRTIDFILQRAAASHLAETRARLDGSSLTGTLQIENNLLVWQEFGSNLTRTTPLPSGNEFRLELQNHRWGYALVLTAPDAAHPTAWVSVPTTEPRTCLYDSVGRRCLEDSAT